MIERDVAPDTLIVPTAVDRLDLLPAGPSLRTLDLLLAQSDRKKRLLRTVEALERRYDRIVIDWPPELGRRLCPAVARRSGTRGLMVRHRTGADGRLIPLPA